MTRSFAAFTILAACVLSSPAEAGPGPGGGKGGGRGVNDRCGSTLLVVFPDGSEKAYKPAGELLKDLPTRLIDQGEEPREAVRLADLLQKAGASWVKTLNCADQSEDFPSGLPVEGEIYVVETGRGALKFVREVRPGVFTNIAEKIKRLRFHASAQAPRDTRKPGARPSTDGSR